MTYLKRLLFVITMLSSTLFADNGFELFINLPIGLNLDTNPNYEIKTDRINKYLGKVKAGLDTGIGIQLGYSKKINTNFSFNLLGNIAYNYTLCYIDNLNYQGSGKNYLQEIHYYINNIKIGIAPKLNHNNFSYTLGFGIIIPLNIDELRIINDNNYIYKAQRISALPFSIYTDFAFDYSFFLTEKIAVTIGAYTGLDIYDTVKSKAFPQSEVQLLVWTLGIRFGFRFAPYNFY